MADIRCGKAVQAGIAGAAALAAGSGAYAGIVVVAPPANLPAAPAPNTSNLAWDVNGDAVVDFNFAFRNPQSASQVYWQANMNPVTGNGVVGYTGPFIDYGTNLSAGQTIGGASVFKTGAQVTLGSIYGGAGGLFYGGFGVGTANPGGAGAGAARGFAGFKFLIGGQTRYGWVDVRVTGGGFEFFGAAYEDSGAPIAAGAVPAPGSLGALALGAAALLRRGKRKDEAAA